MSILETIGGSADLQDLTDAQREGLCREIREFLVAHVAKTGGHLASNLGVVELTVAIETVFDTASDRLVFDVGHQSYVHKLLTGRQADFERLRQFGGIAGFPKPSESITDAFVAGHASSAVSIALGMARARTLTGKPHRVIALLGDGAATGGMVYEGLNDVAESGEPMVIILNDNEMSIDRNVGGMAKHLASLRTKQTYLGMKQRYRNLLSKLPGGKAIYRFTRSVKDRFKRLLLPGTIFENMGLTYLGPVDGHDISKLIPLLRSASRMNRPVLVHVLTQKGRGYAPAENHPSKFHGIGRFDIATGDPLKAGATSFSHAFGQTMCDLAAAESRVCAITAAMPGGTGLLDFKECYANRLFDVGIAEEHAVSMAGGLAKEGMIPVVAIYSTFLQRSYDMIMQDVALLGLHVVFAIDRAGLVGDDGETHHGVFDVGYLRQVPGMEILCPASFAELRAMLSWAVLEHKGPVAIRYPRGGEGSVTDSYWGRGPVQCHSQGSDVTLICYGTMIDNALETARLLSAHGIRATVLRLLSVGNLPVDAICEALTGKHVAVLEEIGANSGISQALAYALGQRKPDCRVYGFDLGGSFVPHGSVAQLHRLCGLDAAAVSQKLLEVISGEN